MMPATGAPASLSAATRRDQLLAALLQHSASRTGELLLVRCDERVAVLVVGERAQLLILSPEAGHLAELSERLRALLDQQPGGTFYLLIVGGAADLRPALARVAREAPDPAGLGMYHLGDDGALVHVAGRRLSLLAEAAARASELTPLSQAEIAAAIAEMAQRQREVEGFARAMGQRFPLVSLILGGACVAIYVGSRLVDSTQGWAPGHFENALRAVGANYGELVRAGQLWRLLSSAFLHGDMMHLFVNMLSLYFLGTFLEKVVGRHRFLMVYGLAALGGSLASALLSGRPSVGSSGAIWGLMLSGYGIALRPGTLLPALVATRIKRALVVPLIVNAWMSFLPGIDLHAHFGGGLTGLAVTLAWSGMPPAGRGLKLTAGLVAALLFVSLGVALVVAFGLAAQAAG